MLTPDPRQPFSLPPSLHRSGQPSLSGVALPPLPDEFSELERAMDARLAAALRRQPMADGPVAPGLVDRVFEASVVRLPAPVLGRVGLASQTASSVGWRRESWSRLAMAASVLLAGGLGLWVMTSQAPGPRGMMALKEPSAHASVLDGRLVAELAWMPQGSAADMESDLSYLLDTSDLTSFEDLSGDLRLLVADLGGSGR